MAYSRPINPTEPVTWPVCVHLRSKAIYVTGQLDPIQPDEAGAHQHTCWCNLTQRPFGPDEGHVDRHLCLPGRSCYRDTR